MNLKNLVSVIVTDVKKDATAVKDFVLKAIPIAEDIATDASDILIGKTPPPTGNKAVDDFVKILSILAPYYPNASALQADIADILSFLQGASSVL